MMEEVDEEILEEDEVESLEDLEGSEEDQEEDKEKKLDPHYPEIYLNNSQLPKEGRVEFCSARIVLKRSQKKLVSFVQQYCGFKSRSEFIRYVLLRFARDQMKLLNAKRETDIKFIKDFQKLRRQSLIEENNVKEKMEELKRMSSQDKGNAPFTAEDLME